jgi:hypothetical protein
MWRNFKCRLTAAAILAALAASAGCAQQSPPPPTATVVRVSPSALFTGELKRLEPHLGLTTGCVRLDHVGSTLQVKLSCEIWEGGKVAKEAGSLGTTLAAENEASLSLREIMENGKKTGHFTIALSGSQGYVASTGQVDLPMLSRGSKSLSGPLELSMGRPTAVWGLMAGEGSGRIDGDESIEDMAKRVEWALILKIAMKGN